DRVAGLHYLDGAAAARGCYLASRRLDADAAAARLHRDAAADGTELDGAAAARGVGRASDVIQKDASPSGLYRGGTGDAVHGYAAAAGGGIDGRRPPRGGEVDIYGGMHSAVAADITQALEHGNITLRPGLDAEVGEQALGFFLGTRAHPLAKHIRDIG